MSKAKLWNRTIAAAQQGFSLVELLIAAGLGVLMVLTAGEVMIQQQRSETGTITTATGRLAACIQLSGGRIIPEHADSEQQFRFIQHDYWTKL